MSWGQGYVAVANTAVMSRFALVDTQPVSAATLTPVKYGLSDAVMARHRPGQIDYRLARQNVLHAFRAGSISRLQICDAQSELTRNATYCGAVVDDPCPVCEAAAIRNVTYVFGPRLPSGGRCITNLAEVARLARRQADYTAYVVEVCVECGWNHLMRSYPLA